MAESYPDQVWPSDGDIEALDGSTDEKTGLPYVAKGTSPTASPSLEVQYNRRLQRQNEILANKNRLRVVETDTLEISVFPGSYTLGGQRKTFEGGSSSVPASSTRYAYLDSSNQLQVAASEPSDLTSFLPLAKVVASGTTMTITDRRCLAEYHVPQIESSADITGTPNAAFQIDDDNSGPKLKHDSGELQVRNAADDDDADLKCGTLDVVDEVQIGGVTAINGSGEATAVATGTVDAGQIVAEAVTGSKLSATLKNMVGQAALSVGSESSDDIDVTVQLKDAIGNDVAQEHLMRLWVGDAVKGGECATAPSGGISVQTGTLLNTITAGKQVEVISDTNGTIVLRLTDTGTPTFYLMTEFDGKVYASSAITFA